MRERNHPRQWASVLLEDRSRLPKTSGVYAVIKQRRIYYIGFSANLNRRWCGKSHHRFLQAYKLGRPSLHYLPLPKERARIVEKILIAHYSPLWNYSKVPVLRKVRWWRNGLMVATGCLVLFIASRSLILGLMAAAVAIALFL